MATACVFAGSLAVLFAWSRLELSEHPDDVFGLTGSPRSFEALIVRDESEGEARALLLHQSRELLKMAPLSDAPLAFAGIAAVRNGDARSADVAFEAAFARSPRNIAARIWLAERAVARGDQARAVDLLDRLIAISPNRTSVYIQTLAQIGATTSGATAIEEKIGAQSPNWGGAVISRLNKTDPDLQRLARLNALNRSTQSEFLTRVGQERGPQAAFMAWLNFIPANDIQEFKWPYNNHFERGDAPAPFNWTLRGDQVEFSKPSGLALTYMGRGRPEIVEQQMLLAPGYYRFTSTQTGQGSVNGGGLRWTIACISGSTELGHVVVREFSTRQRQSTFDFAVPTKGCDAQKLGLRGEPGEYPTIARVEVSAVQIEETAANGQ